MITHRQSFSKVRCLLTAPAWVLAASGSSVAAAESASTEIPEIVVTATHREVALQDVPIAISAVTGAELEKLGADSLQDFAGKIPGLEFASFAPGLNRVTIRGISTQTGESSTGFYIDEMPVTADPTAQPDVRMFDIDRVEILRGPQGTLFGEASLGGTIRIITKRPDAAAFAGAGEVTLSHTTGGGWNYALNGMVNIPLVKDKLALRVVGGWRENAGYIDNVLLNQKNINDDHALNYRATLAWTPSDQTTVLLTYQASDQSNDGEYISNRKREQFRYQDEGRDDEFERANLTIEHNGEWAKFVSSTSYFTRDSVRRIDQTGAASGLLPPGVTVLQTNDVDYEVFAQEMRLASAVPGPIEWIIGGFYKNSERRLVSRTLTNPDLGPLLDGDNDYRFKQWALFGEATWHASDKLHATLGLRYFEESDRFHVISSGALTGPGLDNTSTQKSSELAPRFSLKYDIDDQAMIYATASRGFRAGGANPAKPIFDVFGIPMPVSYHPDTLWNYEVGLKADLMDRRLSFGLAAYYMDWKDIQLPASAAGVFNGTFNGGDAASKGVEAEVTARPTDALTLTFSGNYTDATLSNTVILTTPFGPVVAAAKGNELPLVPRWKMSAGAEYRTPIADGWDVALRANASFVGKRYNFADNNPAERLHAYQIVDLQVAFESDRFDVVLFADNVTDEVAEYAFQGDPSLPGERLFSANQPRTIGVTARARF